MSDFQMWVCREDKHNKFWTYEIVGTTFISRYGRLGLKGQSSSKTFSCTWEAESHARKKLDGKRRKGYESVSEEEYQLLLLQAEVVGSGNKVEEAAFVLKTDDNHAIEVSPEALTNPDLKPSFILSIRLRDKDGATEPYDLHIEENAAYLLDRATKARLWRPKATKLPHGVKLDHAKASWSWASHARITTSHRLAPLVEKAQEVIGTTLL
jgi:predicted DNA-binding WGR domain protein